MVIPHGVLAPNSFCETKVNNFKFAVFAIDDVVKLDVPVDNFLRVDVTEALNNV